MEKFKGWFENAAESTGDDLVVFAVQIWPWGSNGPTWVYRIESLFLDLYIYLVLTG